MATCGGEDVQIVLLYASPDDADLKQESVSLRRTDYESTPRQMLERIGDERRDAASDRPASSSCDAERRLLEEALLLPVVREAAAVGGGVGSAAEEDDEEPETDAGGGGGGSITVKKVVLPTRPELHATESGNGRSGPRAPPSVLRALLQASGKQLTVYQSRERRTPTPGFVPMDLAPTKDVGCQADADSPTPGTTLSRIKALLVGETFSNAEPPTKRPRLNPQGRRLRRTQEHDLSLFLSEVVDLTSEYSDLTYSIQSGRPLPSVEVRRKGLYGIPSPGLTPAQVVIGECGEARFFNLLKSAMATMCKDEFGRLDADRLRPLLLRLSIKGGHVFCPGVPPEAVVGAPTTRNLVCIELCDERYQAKDCPVWYMLAQHSSWLPLNDGVLKCKKCKALERYLLKKTKDKKEVDDSGGGGLQVDDNSSGLQVDDSDGSIQVDDGNTSLRDNNEISGLQVDTTVESDNMLCGWESQVKAEPDGIE